MKREQNQTFINIFMCRISSLNQYENHNITLMLHNEPLEAADIIVTHGVLTTLASSC